MLLLIINVYKLPDTSICMAWQKLLDRFIFKMYCILDCACAVSNMGYNFKITLHFLKKNPNLIENYNAQAGHIMRSS